ncbi:MAG: hypothetical protein FWC40_09990 [Proteobacteria bacterium]|nr:hypothetical protein [Pseudomonadota bacterium]
MKKMKKTKMKTNERMALFPAEEPAKVQLFTAVNTDLAILQYSKGKAGFVLRGSRF